MRILALDVGSKTIGVAVSDPLGITAQGLTTLRRTEMAADIGAIQKIVAEYQVEQIVIGLPLNMNGSQGPAAAMAREVGNALSAAGSPPLLYRDERLTTVMAEKAMLEGDLSRKKRKKIVDRIAAVLILQNYLDYRGHGGLPRSE
ncbi:MAG: Holliday junction resolvase RuvX [Firmicutes bacterium]|nr:Holliday junction resolvase RuvX [Bacillota bacterium]